MGSWDAEEFGLQGSTEWVETHLPWLVSSAIAYLNIDVAVSGPRTALSGSGEIQTIAIETMKKILYPDTWGIGPTLYDMWYNTTEGEIPPLGSGSDYAAFYHAGISAVSTVHIFDIISVFWDSSRLTLLCRLISDRTVEARIPSTITTGQYSFFQNEQEKGGEELN